MAARVQACSPFPAMYPTHPERAHRYTPEGMPPRRETDAVKSAPSSVHLAEHDVDRAEDGRDVGQHVAAAEEVHGGEMGEAGRADLALVRPVGAVGDEIDAELALGRLDRGVNLAGRHVKTFGVELEVVDQRLHGALHLAAARRRDLVVLDHHRTLPVRRARSLDALLHNAPPVRTS